MSPAERAHIDAQRFWKKVRKSSGCWEWQGHLSNGYGIFGHDTKAHRASWQLSVGAIPVGLCVLHRCDNRACVRPDHLFIGTVGDNNKDRAAKGRSKGTFPSGDAHPAKQRLGGKHWCAKLSGVDVLNIRNKSESGETQTAIARHFNVHPATISRIVRREWRGEVV